jgi:DNA-binding Xre family transcriptional regulator
MIGAALPVVPEQDRLVAAPTSQLVAMMRQSGLKMWWVAEQTGMHRTTLQRLFSGRQKKLRQSVLARLVFILETEAIPGAVGEL